MACSVRGWWWGEMLHRLIWCPYLPEHVTEEKEPDTNVAELLVLTQVAQPEVWSLDLGVEEHEPGPLAPGDVEHGLLKLRSRMLVEMSRMGLHLPQPLGMARSSSSKYISMGRFLLVVYTSGVFRKESLCTELSLLPG